MHGGRLGLLISDSGRSYTVEYISLFRKKHLFPQSGQVAEISLTFSFLSSRVSAHHFSSSSLSIVSHPQTVPNDPNVDSGHF